MLTRSKVNPNMILDFVCKATVFKEINEVYLISLQEMPVLKDQVHLGCILTDGQEYQDDTSSDARLALA
jgi:hypothetical protein